MLTLKGKSKLPSNPESAQNAAANQEAQEEGKQDAAGEEEENGGVYLGEF